MNEPYLKRLEQWRPEGEIQGKAFGAKFDDVVGSFDLRTGGDIQAPKIRRV
jgi:hypothetical protein